MWTVCCVGANQCALKLDSLSLWEVTGESLCRETDAEKLKDMCRKALQDFQEQKAANWQLEGKVMRLERDKEVLGASYPQPADFVDGLPGIRGNHASTNICTALSNIKGEVLPGEAGF